MSIEIHVPISLNRHFSTMCHLLVLSLATTARLPGDYRIIFTVSRDTEDGFDSPLFSWTKDHPVEFRWVNRELFDAYRYGGTALQRHLWDFTADVVLFLDADVVAVGPLTEVVEAVRVAGCVLGRTAWAPPPRTDLAGVLARQGLSAIGHGLTYAGYGVDFVSPRHSPPYYNFGFVAMPKAVADSMRKTIADDIGFVYSNYDDFFNPQIVLCSNILRCGYPFGSLDIKFNMGNGDFPRFRFHGDEDAAVHYRRAVSCQEDPRLIHYCVGTPDFAKAADMDGWDRLRAFCARNDLGVGTALLRDGIVDVLRRAGVGFVSDPLARPHRDG